MEDVTRDTYGFTEGAEPRAGRPEERFAQAERAAEAEEIPGIITPEDRFRSDPEQKPEPRKSADDSEVRAACLLPGGTLPVSNRTARALADCLLL